MTHSIYFSIKGEIENREKECKELRDIFGKELENLKNKLEIEEKQREKERDQLQSQIDKLNGDLENAKDDLQNKIDNEKAERISESQQMGDFFG